MFDIDELFLATEDHDPLDLPDILDTDDDEDKPEWDDDSMEKNDPKDGDSTEWDDDSMEGDDDD